MGHCSLSCLLVTSGRPAFSHPLKGRCCLPTDVGGECYVALTLFLYWFFIIHNPIVQIHVDLTVFSKAFKDITDWFLQKQMLRLRWRYWLGINTCERRGRSRIARGRNWTVMQASQTFLNQVEALKCVKAIRASCVKPTWWGLCHRITGYRLPHEAHDLSWRGFLQLSQIWKTHQLKSGCLLHTPQLSSRSFVEGGSGGTFLFFHRGVDGNHGVNQDKYDFFSHI